MAAAGIRAVAVVAVLALAGCAGSSGSGASETSAAPPPGDLCAKLLQDMRLYCQSGLADSRGPTGEACLSRRLEFEQRCM